MIDYQAVMIRFLGDLGDASIFLCIFAACLYEKRKIAQALSALPLLTRAEAVSGKSGSLVLHIQKQR